MSPRSCPHSSTCTWCRAYRVMSVSVSASASVSASVSVSFSEELPALVYLHLV